MVKGVNSYGFKLIIIQGLLKLFSCVLKQDPEDKYIGLFATTEQRSAISRSVSYLYCNVLDTNCLLTLMIIVQDCESLRCWN